ncbi:MAG: aldehyde dehydrogenase family protein [Sphingomonas sp.]
MVVPADRRVRALHPVLRGLGIAGDQRAARGAAGRLRKTTISESRSIEAATGEVFGAPFAIDGPDAAAARAAAAAASDAYRAVDPERRAASLERIGKEIVALGDVLIATAMRESGLPRVRL